MPRNISGHIQFANWVSFVASNLWGNLCVPASVYAFLRMCILGSYWRKVEYLSVLLHTIFLTALMGPLKAPKSGWRETAGMASPRGVGCISGECVFWGKLSLAHRLEVWWCAGISMLQQCNSVCGLLLFLLYSLIYKVPSANFRQNSEAGLLSSAKA